MTDLERLRAIEDIKRLKGLYFFYVDGKQWTRWQTEVWTPDARLELDDGTVLEGAEKITRLISAVLVDDQITTHHGHMPIIDILSDTTATGIWAMEDIIRTPKDKPSVKGYTRMQGFGHYHEAYVRTPDGWRIKSSRITRQHVERT